MLGFLDTFDGQNHTPFGIHFRTNRAVPLMATRVPVVRVLEDELLELGRQPRTLVEVGREHRAMSW